MAKQQMTKSLNNDKADMLVHTRMLRAVFTVASHVIGRRRRSYNFGEHTPFSKWIAFWNKIRQGKWPSVLAFHETAKYLFSRSISQPEWCWTRGYATQTEHQSQKKTGIWKKRELCGAKCPVWGVMCEVWGRMLFHGASDTIMDTVNRWSLCFSVLLLFNR